MALAMSKRLLPFVFFAAVLWSFHLPFTAPKSGPRGRRDHPRVGRWASEGEKEEEEDWREFRARLVQQESGSDVGESGGSVKGISLKKAEKWAYESPIIEQGSILLSAPNDHFCINQQYFHKNVIFLVDHSQGFTKGVILNRPTAFSTSDLESSLQLPDFSPEGTDDWNVWCGGDCQGINSHGSSAPPEYSVLHGLENLEDVSQTITKGVYSIQLEDAKALVKEGKADKDDFLLLVGYCGWGEGQLQGELDREDTWTMASVDPGLLLGQLREEQAELRRRIAKAQEGDVFTADDVGDGLLMWERLFKALGQKYQSRLEDFQEGGENEHSDEMLRLWINRCLIPPRYNPEALQAQEVVERALKSIQAGVVEGSVLRGSASAWLLGKPFEDERFSSQRFMPAQYLHKAVLLVIKNERENDRQGPSLLALLNGPVDPRGDSNIFWAGPHGSNYVYKVLEDSNFEGSFRGFTILAPGVLEMLLEVGALEKCEEGISKILSTDVKDRWSEAGGKIETIPEAKTAQLGDKQRRKWFKRFENLDLEEEE